MGFKEWIIPQDKIFFNLIEKQSKLVQEGAELFNSIVSDYKNLSEKVEKMKSIEHQSDEVVAEIMQKLHRCFITPIDHEDISKLCTTYDDVLDHINSVANWIHIFKLKSPDDHIKTFAKLILKQIEEVNSAIARISKLKEKEIGEIFARVHELEEQVDDLRDDSFVELFQNKDYRKIIIMKEIYGFLEDVADLVDDVCLVVQDIVIKNA